MKNSFLYQKYKRSRTGMVVFIMGLILFITGSIIVSSNRYLDRFVQHQMETTQDYFSFFETDTVERIARWSHSVMTHEAYLQGDEASLDKLFSKRIDSMEFSDVRISLQDHEHAEYLYRGLEIPQDLYGLNHNQEQYEKCFYWVDEELWFAMSDQVDDYRIMLAIPIHYSNLKRLSLFSEGDTLKGIEVSHGETNEGRDFLHLSRLVFSVPIKSDIQAYLTYNFQMDSLTEYFYRSYGISMLLIILFFIWMVHYRLRDMINEAQHQVSQFENGMAHIAAGNYSVKIRETGYSEFDRLGNAVNNLTDTIEARNQELSEHVRELYGLLIQILEQKDPYTRGHSERVANYARGIANVLGLENADKIHAAGLLHDIGKIAIQENLLNKPERITEKEYQRIQNHTQRGYDILMESKEFHRIRMWVLYHHERLDGSGYPMGLKGKEIPFEARIIAVADVYDAMTSKRAYRSELSTEETLAFLYAHEEKWFGKGIVGALETYIKASSEG